MSESRRYRSLAEFVLLIVGVFVALSAETWLSGRSDRQLAESYASDLNDDLARDTLLYRLWNDIATQKVEASRTLLGQLNDPSARLSPPETAVAIYQAGAPFIVQLGTPTYVDLSGSGDLRLLSQPLRRAIVRYEVRVTDFRDVVASLSRPLSGNGLVPGDLWGAIFDCFRTCSETPFTTTRAQMLAVADTFLVNMTPPEQQRLMAWSSVPGIERILERELAEGHRILARFGGPLLQDLVGALEAAAPP
jgi:hypothetical protein